MSTTLADPTHVSVAREFNRFYTAKLGMTRSSVYRTQFSLAEARVLYELGAGVNAVAALKRRTAMDGGQLSRLLKRLEADGLIERLPSPTDGRKQLVKLTGDGEDAFAALDETSREEVGALLDAAADPAAAIAAMEQLRRALEPARMPTVVLRDPEPGDLGWLVERHGALYAREYGWDASFERLVAQIAAEFDPATDRAWIAEVDGTRTGAVLCVHHDETTAKLRTLLVEPSARGLGLGTRLVEQVIKHAREGGYQTLTLWTNDVLHAARHIYERTGFTLQSEAPHRAFGHDLVEQTWSLNLHPWTETR
jgi:DNA-binding MarR family transcriptional regulator/N-acetylglutamate synthase-like GNAT family acetyltransferase